MPLGVRTSNRGPGAGVCASKLSVQSRASAPALVNRGAVNPNVSLEFTGLECVKFVSWASEVAAEIWSVRSDNFQVTAPGIVVQF